MKQCVDYFVRHGSNVYMAALDAKKASDRVNHVKLFSVLFDRRFPAHIIGLIKNWYGKPVIVRPSGRGTVHSRPHKIFLHFHDLSSLLNKIREGVALSPLSILHKTH